MRESHDNKYNMVHHQARRISHRAFFLNADKRFIDAMKRSTMFDHVYSYHLDRLASDGGVTYTYDAAGNCTAKTEDGAATGLINFRMRWYDPVTGRWLSKDPIGLSGGLNLYAFCEGDPMNFINELGLSCNDDDGPKKRTYFDRYRDIVEPLLIDPTPILPLAPIGLMPKKWAPSTGGRPPGLGSKNPWTSIPRGLGFDRGSLRPFLRSAGFRSASAVSGAALLGVGVWNAGVLIGASIGAIYSD